MNYYLKSIVKQYNEKAAEVEELKLKLSKYENNEVKEEPKSSCSGWGSITEYPVSYLAEKLEEEIESLKEKYISLAEKAINIIDKVSNNNCDC
jgi:hypothetical protein